MSMPLGIAKWLLTTQDESIRKLNKKRFMYGNYEYRLAYNGGFAPMIKIERREIGRRNFHYWDSVDVSHCLGCNSAMEHVMDSIANYNW